MFVVLFAPYYLYWVACVSGGLPDTILALRGKSREFTPSDGNTPPGGLRPGLNHHERKLRMLRQSLKVIAAFWAVLFATVAVAGDGIRLSEWGDATLPEQSVPAKAGIHRGDKWVPAFAGKESGGLGLGEFLIDEARSFGAGALDGEQLRKALANRAIGKDGAGIRDWMANRWESAPGRFGAHMAGYAEGQLESLSWVESADVRWTPSADDAFGAFSASGVGGLRTGADSFFGIQPKIQRDNDDGKMSGSFGVFQRRAFGDWAVAGVNAFVDYADDPTYGEFARWSLGADFASSWVDGNASRYFSNEGRKVRIGDSVFQAYVPDGVSAELRVHSPGLNWLEGYATFTKWEGRGPNPDTINRAYGVSFAPRAGWKVDAETTDGDDFGARVAYAWTLGEESSLATVEPFGVYTKLTDPAVRIDAMTITTFKVYEAAALYELQDAGLGSLSAEELEKRVSLSWLMVPEHLRITEKYRGKCVPPIFSVNDNFGSLVKAGAEQVANNSGSWGYADEDVNRKAYASSILFGGGFECFAFLSGLKGADIDLRGNYPLHNAMTVPFEDWGPNMVRLAILAGADVSVKYDPDLADERRNIPDWEGDLEDYRDYTPVDFAQHHYSSFGVHIYSHLSGLWEYVALGCDTILGDLDTFHSVTGLYSVDEWWRSACLGWLKSAEIMGKSGGRCGEFESGSVCTAAKQDVVDWKPEMPPNGDLVDDTISEVMPGYTGEVFRVTATTAYADVDFTLFADSGVLTVRRDGTVKSFNNSGANHPYFDRGYNTASGRINSGDETKVAIVELTKRVGFDVQVTATLEARFFYHVNELNTVTLAFTLSSKADPETRNIVFNKREYGTLIHLSTPELVNERFAKTGGSDNIGIDSGGAITVYNATVEGTVLTLFAESEADNLLGTMRFAVEAMVKYSTSEFFRNNPDFENPIERQASSDYAGPLFTVTVHPPHPDVSFSAQSTVGAMTYRLLEENVAEILWADENPRPDRISGVVIARVFEDNYGQTSLNKSFVVTTVPSPPTALATLTTYNPGTALTLSVNVDGATYTVAAGSHSDVAVSSDGVLSVTAPYLTDRTATVLVEATAPGFLGALQVTAELWTTVSLPDFPVYYAAAGYEGVITTVTLASTGKSLTWEFNSAQDQFTLSVTSPAIGVVHGRMLERDFYPGEPRTVSGRLAMIPNFRDGEFYGTSKGITVSVRGTLLATVYQIETDDSGDVVQLPDLVGATGVAVGTAGRLVPGTDGWLRLSSALDFGESATLTVDFTSPNFLGTERWTVAVMVPEFGVLSEKYSHCVCPDGECLNSGLNQAMANALDASQNTIQETREQLVCALIQQGANPNLRYGNFHPPLNLAIYNGDLEIVRMLLAAGADPNEDVGGDAVLIVAASRANVDIAEVLLLQEARVDEIRADRNPFAPIHTLARNSDEHSIADQAAFTRLLIEYDVDPDQGDRNGNTYLHHLIQSSDNVGSLEEFLTNPKAKMIDANRGIHDNYNHNARKGTDKHPSGKEAPLVRAAEKGRSAIIGKLLSLTVSMKKKLDVNKDDFKTGLTPLHVVRDVALMNLLLAHGADQDRDTEPGCAYHVRNLPNECNNKRFPSGWRPLDQLAYDDPHALDLSVNLDEEDDLYLQLGRILWAEYLESGRVHPCQRGTSDYRLCRAETYN